MNLLIRRSAEVNHRNHKDYSPLAILCAQSGDDDMVEVLIKSGAKLDEMYAGKTLLMIASEEYNCSAVLKLLELGSNNVNTIHAETGKTALHFACENFVASTVSALLRHNADHTITDNKNNKPINLITDKDERAKFLGMIN